MEKRIEEPDTSDPFRAFKKDKMMFNLNDDEDEQLDGNLIDDDDDDDFGSTPDNKSV